MKMGYGFLMELPNSPEAVRLIIFIGLLALLGIAEAVFPRKIRALPRSRRWMTNIGLVIIDSVVVRFMGPLIAISVAVFAASKAGNFCHSTSVPAIWGFGQHKRPCFTKGGDSTYF